jgi:N-methylhydantoinase A
VTAAGAVVGVDIGGTFTDVALLDERGRLTVGKQPTTPEDPRVGVVESLRHVLHEAGVEARAVGRVVHGTTLATNVVVERRGGPVALVTTEGFGDLLALGRQARVEEDRYDLAYTPPAPLVAPALTFEVPERVTAHGEVLVPLRDADLAPVVRAVADARPAGVAVCLLHSYAVPDHERRVAAACRSALPDAFVVASCDVWPELREYERAMTTVVCALVGPIMATYLAGLEEQLAALGVRCPIEVMESSGGVVSTVAAIRRPVCTVESGGAAGVLAAGAIGASVGAADVISFDMGGTTAKTGIVRDGRPALAHDFQIAGRGSFGGARPGTGVPVKVPVVDLAEVGAGGGSVAWLDPGGTLRVGPRSAGAVPGPACYGRGGTDATVTDANLLLGYLGAHDLAGGVTLEPARAETAVAPIAAALGVEPFDAAEAIHEIANTTMAAAIRMVTVQRGIDPRDFTLVAFGGAGPVHVARLAAQFGIRAVLVPWAAGVASAVGLLRSEPTIELVQTVLVELDEPSVPVLEAAFADLEDRARRELAAVDAPTARVTRSADLRYRGQAHQLTVAVPPDGHDVAALTRAFHDTYRQAYGVASDAPVEFVSARVRVTHPRTAALARAAEHPTPTPAVADAARPVRFVGTGEFRETPVFDWARLAPGACIAGAGLVVGADTTVVVPAGATATVDGERNLRLSPAPGAMAGVAPSSEP